LQDGSPTSMSAAYQNLVKRFLADYPGHGIDNNNTQYFEKTGPAYIQNKGGFGGFYVDNTAYPKASGCSGSATPVDCLSDAQLQAEIRKVAKLKGWTGGTNKMYLLFTSSGEDSCMTPSDCASNASTGFCAYHSSFGSGANTFIYGDELYGDAAGCTTTTGVPSPNNFPDADAAVDTASHELSEAITDWDGTAWGSAQGNEIGDLCSDPIIETYGPATWDGHKANQMWNGNFYEIQMEFDNHKGNCQQIGP
jgi:hypothetical protein